MARDRRRAARAMMRALVPGFEPRVAPSRSRRSRVGVAWLGAADPLVRAARRGGGGAASRARGALDLPLAEDARAVFMREVADVHRELFAEHARPVRRRTSRAKVERCLAGHRRARPTPARARRERYRERFAASDATGSTCSSRRRCPSSRRLPARTNCELREPRSRSSPIRSTRSAGRRSRCPAGPPRTACPPRCSSSAAAATTRSCSRPASCSSALLKRLAARDCRQPCRHRHVHAPDLRCSRLPRSPRRRSATQPPRARRADRRCSAFLLRADEPPADRFPRTPSFAWTPYAGAAQLRLRARDEQDVRRERDRLVDHVAHDAARRCRRSRSRSRCRGSPATRTRSTRTSARTPRRGVTPLERAVRLQHALDERCPSSYRRRSPGLVRWKPVEGATSYEVWFVDAGKVITTTTNVADEREYYTFHHDPPGPAVVQLARPRRPAALRLGCRTGCRPSYGPWSPSTSSVNPPASRPGRSPARDASDTTSRRDDAPRRTASRPGSSSRHTATTGSPAALFRVYVATDRQCVNIVFTGAVVGSPAYAPAHDGPIVLAGDARRRDGRADHVRRRRRAGRHVHSRLRAVTTSGTRRLEAATQPTHDADRSPATADDRRTAAGRSRPTSPRAGRSSTSGTAAGRPAATTGRSSRCGVQRARCAYHDAAVPQDACAAGRVARASARRASPWSPRRRQAVRLGPRPRRAARRPPDREALLLPCRADRLAARARRDAATRCSGARRAPVEDRARRLRLHGGDLVLLEALTPGTWYYRVRGIDPYVPGPVKQMTLVDARRRSRSRSRTSPSRAASLSGRPRRSRVAAAHSAEQVRLGTAPPRRSSQGEEAPAASSGAPTTST